MPTLQSYADRLADILESNPSDPRIKEYRKIINYELDALGVDDLEVEASPEVVQALRSVEVRATAKDPGAGKSVLIGAGRGFKETQYGVEQLGGTHGRIKALVDAGIPYELASDPRALESMAIGAPYMYPGEKPVGPGGGMIPGISVPDRTFTATPVQQAVVRKLTTMDKTLANKRTQEREVYREGVEGRNPVAATAGRIVGSLASTPIPPIASRSAAKIGTEAAHEAAKSAGFKTGAQLAAREAPAAAAASAIQETEEGQSRASSALEAALWSSGLSVGSEFLRGAIYKWRTRQRLTDEERKLVEEVAEEAGIPAQSADEAAQGLGPNIPPEMAESLKAFGYEAPQSGTIEAMRGALSQPQKAELLKTLTEQEVKALSPAQQERLAIFRKLGYEPTPAQVMGDYRGMDDIAKAEQSRMDEAGDAVRMRMAQARQAPVIALERSKAESGGGLDVEQLPQIAKQAIRQTGATQKASVGEAYDLAAEEAAGRGYRVAPKNTVAALDNAIPQFRVGEAGQGSVAMMNFAKILEAKLPEDIVRSTREKVREDLTKGLLRQQEEGPAMFRAYSEYLGELDPITLEAMRKEVSRMKATTPGDMRVKESLKAAIDKDISELPEDVYKAARDAASARFRFIESVPQLANLFKNPDAISDEKMYSELMRMPLAKFGIVDDWIKKHGTADTRNLWSATQKMMATKFYDDLLMATTSRQLGGPAEEGGKAVAQLNSATFGKYLDNLISTGRIKKVERLIGKKGVEELGVIRRYLQQLEVPKTGKMGSNPSGTGEALASRAREYVDRLAASGDAGKRALANMLNNAINRASKVVQESPDATARRVVDSEMSGNITERTSARMADIRERLAADKKIRREGFTTGSDRAAVLSQRAISRPGEEDE